MVAVEVITTVDMKSVTPTDIKDNDTHSKGTSAEDTQSESTSQVTQESGCDACAECSTSDTGSADTISCSADSSGSAPSRCSGCDGRCGCVTPRVDGRWSWVVMVTSFFMTFLVDGIAFSFGVLFPELLDAFGAGRTRTSVVGSVLTGVYLIAGPLASALSEKFGFRPVAMAGSLIAALGFIAGSFVTNIDLLTFTYGALGGLGFSFMFLTSMVSVTLYFNRWRSIAVGIASCGSGVGIFVFPLLIRWILDHYGWEEAVRAQGGIVLAGLLLGITFLPLDPCKAPKDTDATRPKRGFLRAMGSLLNVSLFKDSIFLLLAAMAVTSTIGIIIPFVFTPDMAEERGISRDQAAFLVSIMGATNTAGRVVVGLASYRLPAHPLLLLAAGHLGGGIVTLFIALYNDYAAIATFSALFGLVYAIDAALSTVILVRTLGTECLSGAFGLLCLCRGIASLCVGPLAGYLESVTGSYDATFYLAGTAILLTSFLSLMAWVLARRREKSTGYDVSTLSQPNGSVTLGQWTRHAYVMDVTA